MIKYTKNDDKKKCLFMTLEDTSPLKCLLWVCCPWCWT